MDTGELVDVAVAQRAGFGGLLAARLIDHGRIWFFLVDLGEIVTNISFETDEAVPFGCGDCMRCVYCLSYKALLGDGRMNAQRCLSYQTQTKGMMPEEYRKKMHNVI